MSETKSIIAQELYGLLKDLDSQVRRLFPSITNNKPRLTGGLERPVEIFHRFIQVMQVMSLDVLMEAPATLQFYRLDMRELDSPPDENIEAAVSLAIHIIAGCIFERAIEADEPSHSSLQSFLSWYFQFRRKTMGESEFSPEYYGHLLGTGIRVARNKVLEMRDEVSHIRDESLVSIGEAKSAVLTDLQQAAAETRGIIQDQLAESKSNLKGIHEALRAYKEEFEEASGKTADYMSVLKKLQGDLGFLTLGKAFTDFIDEKKLERGWLLCWLLVIGVLVVGVPSGVATWELIQEKNASVTVMASQAVVKNGLDEAAEKGSGKEVASKGNQGSPNAGGEASANVQVGGGGEIGLWRFLYLLPISAIELILVFYFRVVLGQFHSVNAQLLQLRMRLAVCRFLESYGEFREKNKALPFEKFDALVFSNLMPNADQVPSTFDGLEGLAKIFDSVRGRGAVN